MSSFTVSLTFSPCCLLLHIVFPLYVCLYVRGRFGGNVWWAMKDNGYGNVRHIQTHRHTPFGQTVVYHTDWIQGHNLTYPPPPPPQYVISPHIPIYTVSATLTQTFFLLSSFITVCYDCLCKPSTHVTTLEMGNSVTCGCAMFYMSTPTTC